MKSVGEFGLARSNKTAALLVTVKGKSLCDGLWPPLTVTVVRRPSKASRDEEMVAGTSNKEME